MGEWSLCRVNMEGRTEVAEDGLCLVFYGIWSSLWGPWGTTEFLSRDIIILFVLWQAHGSSQVALVVKNPPANAGDVRDLGSVSGSGSSLEEGTATTPVFLPGESHGRRSWWLWSTGSQRVTAEEA